jgi:hypothetical protein
MNSSASSKMFSALACVLTGALLFVAAGCYVFWPQNLLLRGSDYQSVLLDHITLFQATYLAIALSALFGLGTVLAVQERLAVKTGVMQWAGLLGMLGFAVMAVNFMYLRGNEVNLAYNYRSLMDRYDGYGLRVERYQPGEIWLAPYHHSPAAQAGIAEGDVLLSIGGQAVTDQTTAMDVLQALWDAEKNIQMTVQTGGQPAREIDLVRGPVQYWDVAGQVALNAGGAPSLDPDYLLSFGLVGVWMLIVNFAALRGAAWPKWLAILGMVVAVAYGFFAAGFVFNVNILRQIGQVGGLVIGPVWYIVLGILLGRQR